MKQARFAARFTTLIGVLIVSQSGTRLLANPPYPLPIARAQSVGTQGVVQAQALPLKFASAKTYNAGTLQNGFVAVGDLNGDGHPDVVVAGVGAPSTIGVLLGKGDGTFNPPATYSSGGNFAYAVVIGDVNGDGIPDLVVANEYANDHSTEGVVGVLLGNGDGTFRAAVGYDSGGNGALSVTIADVNGDRHPDIIVANQCIASGCSATGTGSVGILLNDGKGAFLPAATYSSGALYADSVAVGDFNRDGKPDIVVANKCPVDGNCNTENGSLGVLLNMGDGTFKAPVMYSSGGYEYALAVAVADLNSDRKLDLIVGNWCQNISVCGGASPTGGVSVLLGKGDGTFQLPVTYAGGTGDAASIAVGDVNGDGHPDVLLTGGSNVDVLLGNGDGTLQAPVGVANFQTTAAVAIADLNADGRPDLVVGDEYSLVSVILNALRAPASTVVKSSANPSLINRPVTFTATVTSASPIPDGTVITFYSQTELGTAKTTKGVARLTVSFPQAKIYSVRATFAGDPFHGTSTGYVTGGEVVTLYPSTTTVVSSPNPSSSGQAVTLAATVTSGAPGGPTGKVTFMNGTTWLGMATLSGGTAVVTTKNLPIGTLTITASYHGDSQSAISSGTTSQTVQ
jgi:Bacterial Ig-like domain (group 3)/FG-GAP-like repeat